MSTAGEFEFLEWIRAQQQAAGQVVLPAGDDLAVLRWLADDLLLVGVDQVLDGVHFDSSLHSPRQIGAKVTNRNLSDCAAMACLPAGAVATVALPRGRGLDYARELYLGMREAGDAFDCPIVGGDTASWAGPLALTLTILGRSAGIEPITRRDARPGDTLFVTGPLGGSILGRHLSFTPRIREARALASSHPIHAMIDLSDGLSRDLAHICRQSGLRAILQAERIPIHPDAITLSQRDGVSPLDHALHDGEDHELLFAAPLAHIDNCHPIGHLEPGQGITLIESHHPRPLEPRGWEHRL